MALDNFETRAKKRNDKSKAMRIIEIITFITSCHWNTIHKTVEIQKSDERSVVEIDQKGSTRKVFKKQFFDFFAFQSSAGSLHKCEALLQDLKERVDFAQDGISQMKLKLLQQEAPCHPTAGLKQQD